MRGRQVLPIIIAEMIIGDNGLRAEPSPHKIIHENRLKFRLSSFKNIPGYGNLPVACEVQDTRDQSILRRSVDVGALKF
jgi:hypothetical protein